MFMDHKIYPASGTFRERFTCKDKFAYCKYIIWISARSSRQVGFVTLITYDSSGLSSLGDLQHRTGRFKLELWQGPKKKLQIDFILTWADEAALSDPLKPCGLWAGLWPHQSGSVLFLNLQFAESESFRFLVLVCEAISDVYYHCHHHPPHHHHHHIFSLHTLLHH